MIFAHQIGIVVGGSNLILLNYKWTHYIFFHHIRINTHIHSYSERGTDQSERGRTFTHFQEFHYRSSILLFHILVLSTLNPMTIFSSFILSISFDHVCCLDRESISLFGVRDVHLFKKKIIISICVMHPNDWISSCMTQLNFENGIEVFFFV